MINQKTIERISIMGKFEIYNPLFQGFYNTIFEIDESDIDAEIDYFCDNHKNIDSDLLKEVININYDTFVKEDWNGYKNYVGEKSCEVLEDFLREKGFDCKVVFENVYSPREYNFSNDSVNCSIEVDDNFIDKVRNFVLQYSELFAEYIKDNYTSYDGFMSYYSNNSNDWIKHINEDISAHELGSILLFILLVEDDELKDFSDVVDEYNCNLYDDIYKNEYVHLSDKIEENSSLFDKYSKELKKLKEQGEEYILIMGKQHPEKNYWADYKYNIKKIIDDFAVEICNQIC